MAYESQVRGEKAEEPRSQGECDQQRVLNTLSLIEKGAKQAFLDNELGIEETKSILDEIGQAKEACQAGDENACVVLDSLMSRLTKH